jgi:hypothetical protein
MSSRFRIAGWRDEMARTIGTAARIGILGFLGLAAVAAPAAAQTATSLPTALATASPSKKMWVVTADGHELRGTLADFSLDGVRLRTKDGLVTLRADDVQRIDVKDGIGDGAAKGAVIGALAGAIPAALFIANYGECPCEGSANFVAFFGLIGTGIGAGIGAGSDALLTKRIPIYRASPRLIVAPVVAPGRVAVGGAFRW